MKARLVRFGEMEVEGERYTHDVVIDGGKSTEKEERTFQTIPRKVRPHAAFGWGKNSLGRQAIADVRVFPLSLRLAESH
jgi:hypothetical protein